MSGSKRSPRGILVGRLQEIAGLEAALLSDRRDAIDVIGPPGIGKRSLLRRVIGRESVRRRFDGGVVIVSERTYRPWVDGLAAFQAGGTAIPNDDASQLSDALIVVDAPPSARMLRDLAESVTRIESNRIVTMSPGGFHLPARPFPVPPLSEGESIELLQTLTPSLAHGDAHRIAAACGGSPLALRLAVGLLQRLGARGIVARLERWEASSDPIGVLTDDRDDAPEALTVFPGGILPRGAAVVAFMSSDDLHHVAQQGWLDHGNDGRYHLPPTLRGRLEARASTTRIAEAITRWRAFVVDQIDAIPSVGFGRLEVDAFDLWHLLAEARSFDLVAQRPRAWLHWVRGTGSVEPLERYLAWARIRAAAESADPVVHASLAFLHGGCLAELGQLPRAETLLRETLAQLAPNEPAALFGLEQLGQTLFRGSRFEEAAAVLTAALKLAEGGSHDAIAGSIHGSLGQVRLMMGRPEAAAEALGAAIASKTRRGHLLLALPDQNALALVRIAAERHADALGILDDALNASHALRERNLRPYLLHARAVALLESGRATKAYDAALSAFEAILPRVHGAVVPLLKVTLVRAMIARNGHPMDRDTLRDAVRRALEAGGGAAWYAVLAVAEALGEEGIALYDHLAEAPLEGHLLSLAQRRRRGTRSGPPGEPRALIAVFAPWLLA